MAAPAASRLLPHLSDADAISASDQHVAYPSTPPLPADCPYVSPCYRHTQLPLLPLLAHQLIPPSLLLLDTSVSIFLYLTFSQPCLSLHPYFSSDPAQEQRLHIHRVDASTSARHALMLHNCWKNKLVSPSFSTLPADLLVASASATEYCLLEH